MGFCPVESRSEAVNKANEDRTHMRLTCTQLFRVCFGSRSAVRRVSITTTLSMHPNSAFPHTERADFVEEKYKKQAKAGSHSVVERIA
jgi:hypothetical protein